MKPVRDLLAELVERRLWPVAVVLVAALVAIPLVLAKSPAPSGGAEVAAAPSPAVAAAAAAATPEEPLVSVADTAPGGAALRGHVKNPFIPQHVPKAESASGGSEPVSDGFGGGAPVGGGDTGGSGGTGSPGEQPGTQKTYTRAAIDVRFGKALQPPLKDILDVPRLTPLPSAASPVVIFVGMRPDMKTAVFMISSDVHAQGDGTCVPTDKTCEAIEMQEGDIAFLDVTAANGKVTQYELDLVKVTLTQTTSRADAATADLRSAEASALTSGGQAHGAAIGEAQPVQAVTAP